jgi:hypothetical protein
MRKLIKEKDFREALFTLPKDVLVSLYGKIKPREIEAEKQLLKEPEELLKKFIDDADDFQGKKSIIRTLKSLIAAQRKHIKMLEQIKEAMNK